MITLDEYVQFERRFLSGYASADLKEAEQALLNHRSELGRLHKDGVKWLNYEIAMGITDARISVFYDQIGRASEAEDYRATAITSLTAAAVKDGKAPMAYTKTDIERLVQQADAKLKIGWRK
ncbi:MAG TPA: hypothetical protein VK968_00325 [Roseimicrobium sp.]|nr:hypothetical protein [Roseimicrobium sp.]